jgi:L-iditol 2-dehydrogenase
VSSESEPQVEFSQNPFPIAFSEGEPVQAAVFQGNDNIQVLNVPDPVLEDGEVLLEVDACSVCGTDLHTFHYGHKNIVAPRILGHEFSGRMVESRAPNARVKVGDRVVMYIVLACGKCRYCQVGRTNLCESRTTVSYQHDGAFAKYIKIPA